MKCINGDKVEEFPFGYKLIGRRFDDIQISIREIEKARRLEPELMLRYLDSLKYTIRLPL